MARQGHTARELCSWGDALDWERVAKQHTEARSSVSFRHP